jgi:hypothetical protein
MHNQYDEEAEGENEKRMMMKTMKMLKYRVLYPQFKAKRCSRTLFYNFGLWQHPIFTYSIFPFPLPTTSASLPFPLCPWTGAPDSGAGRPNTTSRDVGRDGFFFLGLGWDLSGVEGGRNVGSSFSSSEESSSEVNTKGEAYCLSAGMGTLLDSPLLRSFHRLSISLS